jgi:hypothetical protein
MSNDPSVDQFANYLVENYIAENSVFPPKKIRLYNLFQNQKSTTC